MKKPTIFNIMNKSTVFSEETIQKIADDINKTLQRYLKEMYKKPEKEVIIKGVRL